MIVDDDQFDRNYITSALQDIEVGTLSHAFNAQDAIRQLKENTLPDMIFLDIYLHGGMDGYDVLNELELLDKTGSIKVILMSSVPRPSRDLMLIVKDTYSQLSEDVKKVVQKLYSLH